MADLGDGADLMTAPIQQVLLAVSPPAAVNNKAIDGHATGTFSGTNTGTVTLTTTSANDVIVVMISSEKIASAQTVSTVTSSQVTFAKRAGLAFVNANNNSNQNLEIWWGKAPAALTAEVITITLSGNIDDASYTAFGVSGAANPASPWDTNVSVPASNKNTSGTASTVTVSGVTTNSSIPMMIGMYGSSTNATSTITGFTQISQITNPGGALFSTTAAYFENFSNAQSSASYVYSSNAVFGAIIDALV